MFIKFIKALFTVFLLLTLAACGGTGALKNNGPDITFSNNLSEVQNGALTLPGTLILDENVRNARYAVCIVEQLTQTKGGQAIVHRFLNTTQAGYREGQYVNGNADWEDNLGVGVGVGLIEYFLSKRAEGKRVAQNYTLAESTCAQMLSNVIKYENDATIAFKNKLNANKDLYNTAASVSPKAKKYLCLKMRVAEFCGG